MMSILLYYELGKFVVWIWQMYGESPLTETMGIRRLLPSKLFRFEYVLQAT